MRRLRGATERAGLAGANHPAEGSRSYGSARGWAVGIDGCRGGWVVAQGPAGSGPETIAVTESLASWRALIPTDRPICVAIDIPLGYASQGARACDSLARRALGWPRSASVFSAPPLASLAASDYATACEAAAAATGKKISIEAWNLAPKIREARSALAPSGATQDRFHAVETHPELVFARLAHGALRESKRSPEGLERRRQLLHGAIGQSRVERLLVQRRELRGAKPDDRIDALAAWLTAARLSAGLARRVPEEPPSDPIGFAEAIYW